MDPKLMKVFGGVIAGFFVFIIILFMVASCSKKTYTYDKLQEKMLAVAKAYYEENEKELPANDQDTKIYTLKKMIADDKIDEISKLFGDDSIKCDGNVTVTNNNGYYLYSPYLSCGKDYESTYLNKVIIDNSLVETGVGLYEVGDEYIMRGEVKNNYVKFNDQLFRIIRINDDGTIKLLQYEKAGRSVWDNRYNQDTKGTNGINEYIINDINSRIKEFVDEYYQDETKWPKEAKAYIVNKDLCIGKRAIDDTSKDGSTECSKILESQPFGLVAAYEFLAASLDPSCNATKDKTCRNYNWFSTYKTDIHTLTASSADTRTIYNMYRGLTDQYASTSGNVNITVNITDKAVYISGDGTLEDPYVFS